MLITMEDWESLSNNLQILRVHPWGIVFHFKGKQYLILDEGTDHSGNIVNSLYERIYPKKHVDVALNRLCSHYQHLPFLYYWLGLHDYELHLADNIQSKERLASSLMKMRTKMKSV